MRFVLEPGNENCPTGAKNRPHGVKGLFSSNWSQYLPSEPQAKGSLGIDGTFCPEKEMRVASGKKQGSKIPKTTDTPFLSHCSCFLSCVPNIFRLVGEVKFFSLFLGVVVVGSKILIQSYLACFSFLKAFLLQ